MKAWHIRLVALDGTPARFKQLGLRLILMWVLPLLGAAAVWGLSRATSWPSALTLIVVAPFTVLIPTWFTPQQQFLHDLLAGTRLINVAVSTNP
jgi:uncharacterized RDD family membrane protein YckC